MPVNYQLGKIYKIESYQTNEIYIGSTCEKYISNRLAGHKKNYINWKKGISNFISSFDILKYDDHFITLIEIYPCNSKIELHKREGHWIRQLQCVNKNIPGRTKKEYRNDNIELDHKANKKWRDENKLKIYEHKKNYRLINKERLNEQKRNYHYEKKIDKMMEKVKYENYKIDVILSEYSYFILKVLSTFD